ncbi:MULTISPECIES: hypothetical protein [Methylobacter]|uniref:hypothetical protein n=1 Tax=Methylobacter TaxID=429 RepID=UPI000374E69C|nr:MULTISPECIES: hypothetical protein [Methylobacter]
MGKNEWRKSGGQAPKTGVPPVFGAYQAVNAKPVFSPANAVITQGAQRVPFQICDESADFARYAMPADSRAGHAAAFWTLGID